MLTSSATPNGGGGGVKAKLTNIKGYLAVPIVVILLSFLFFYFFFFDERRLLPPVARFYARGDSGPVMFNFGDSNSDTGGLAAVKGYHLNLPEGRVFGHPTGRLCDGRLPIDFLCESLHTHYLTPYMKAVGSDFSNGANFAVAGASILPRDVHIPLYAQLQQFLFFKARSLELVSEGAVANGLINEKGFSNALYIIDMGHNDLSGLLDSVPFDELPARFPPLIAEIAYAIETLHNEGGRNFMIHGTGALGCLPQKLAMPWKNNSDIDENGCLETYNNGVKAFNDRLSNMCDEMSSKLKDSTIVFVDMLAIKYDLVANHTKYGFTHPLQTCCGVGSPSYEFNPKTGCLSAGSKVCDDGSEFISWDGIHLTDAANSIIAAKIITGEYSKPNLKFDFFTKSLTR